MDREGKKEEKRKGGKIRGKGERQEKKKKKWREAFCF